MQLYASVADIDSFATANGFNVWLSLSTDDKNRAALLATLDVIAYHGQPNDDTDTPFLVTDPDLQRAAVLQALFVGQNLANLDTADAIRSISAGSYADGALSVSSAGKRRLIHEARLYVDEVMRYYGLAGGTFARG